MPDIGSAPSKTYTRSDGVRTGPTIFAQEESAGIGITSANMDYASQDIATALNNRVMLDGGNQPSAALPMGGQNHTNVGAATSRTNYARASQVVDSELNFAFSSAGTNTITATLNIAPTAYVIGQVFRFRPGTSNTGPATLNVNGLGVKDIRKGPDGSLPLVAGDITALGLYTFEYDGTNFQLINPGVGRNVTAYAASILDDADAASARTTLGLGTIATQNANSVAITGGTVNATSLQQGGTAAALQIFPTVQRFTAGSGTYTPSAGTRYIRVRMVGGGGGGGAASTNSGSDGGATTFASWVATGGTAGGPNGSAGGDGGASGATGTGTTLARVKGGIGGFGASGVVFGGAGGNSAFGGAGGATVGNGVAGQIGAANSGSGGSGGVQVNGGAGGGAGEYVDFLVNSPAAVSYAVGAAGAGGAAGGSAGGNGGSGVIIVEEYY